MLRQPLYDSEITDTHTSAEYPMGDLREYDHPTYGYQIWRYVKATAALGVGVRAVQTGSNPYECAVGAVNDILAAHHGVAQHAIAINNYGWVLASGHGLVKSDAVGHNAGDPLFAAALGAFDVATVGTNDLIAYAVTAGSAGDVDGVARIQLL